MSKQNMKSSKIQKQNSNTKQGKVTLFGDVHGVVDRVQAAKTQKEKKLEMFS